MQSIPEQRPLCCVYTFQTGIEQKPCVAAPQPTALQRHTGTSSSSPAGGEGDTLSPRSAPRCGEGLGVMPPVLGSFLTHPRIHPFTCGWQAEGGVSTMCDLRCHVYILLGKLPELRQVNSDLQGKAPRLAPALYPSPFCCKNLDPALGRGGPPFVLLKGAARSLVPRCPVGAALHLWAPQTSVGMRLLSCIFNTPRGSLQCQPGCLRHLRACPVHLTCFELQL